MSSTVVNLLTGETAEVPDWLCDERPVDYPHVWFDAHPNTKPSITLGYKQFGRITLYRKLKGDLAKCTLNLQMVKAYLGKYFRDKIKIKSSTAWSSFGVAICAAGEDVTPLTVMKVTEEDTNWEGEGGAGHVTDAEEKVFVGFLLLIYRVLRLPYQGLAEGTERLKIRFTEVFACDPPGLLKSALTHFGSWMSDPGYRALVASVDMFFCKFPQHAGARLRLGTSASRWRDCAALKSMLELAKKKQLDLDTFEKWIWTDAVLEDLKRMTKFTQEIEDDGYIPYMSDFGFCNRSPYSVTANPAMHFFCQIILCTMGDERGINAHMVFPPDVIGVLRNALIMGFATTPSFFLAVGSSDNQNLPTEPDPMKWYTAIVERNVKLGEPYSRFLQTVQGYLKNLRPGSVGKWLENRLPCI